MIERRLRLFSGELLKTRTLLTVRFRAERMKSRRGAALRAEVAALRPMVYAFRRSAGRLGNRADVALTSDILRLMHRIERYNDYRAVATLRGMSRRLAS